MPPDIPMVIYLVFDDLLWSLSKISFIYLALFYLELAIMYLTIIGQLTITSAYDVFIFRLE